MKTKTFLITSFALLLLIFASQAFAATMTLTWTDNSNNEDGFIVERKTNQDGTFAEVARTIADIVTHADTTPDSGLYCYRVKAFNAAGDSPYSNEACATALTTPNTPVIVTITVTVP